MFLELQFADKCDGKMCQNSANRLQRAKSYSWIGELPGSQVLIMSIGVAWDWNRRILYTGRGGVAGSHSETMNHQ